MENFSLRNKIIIMLILPILVILLMSGETLYLKVKETKSIKKTSSYVDLSLKSTKLLNTLQQEKEYSLIFLKSYGKKYDKELSSLREEANKHKIELLSYLDNFDTKSYSQEFLSSTKKVVEDLKKIDEIRKKVDSIAISDDELLNYYQGLNLHLLFYINDVLVYNNDGKLSKKLQAYSSLVNITEAASKERRIIYQILENGVLFSDDYSQFNKLISIQNTYLDIFEKMLSVEEYKGFSEKLKACSECNEVENYRKIIENKALKDEIIKKVYELSGFGGLVENYSDYLLKGDDSITNKMQRFHSSILRELNRYRRVEGISAEEKKLIKKIKNTFDEYMGTTLDIQEGYSQGKSIKEIYSAISIENSEAIEALAKLNNTIFDSDYNRWFEVATKRIDYFKKYGEDISEDIKSYIKEKDSSLVNGFIMTLVFVIVVILIVFIVSSLITKKIVKQLNIFKEGLEYSFQYVIREKESLKPIVVTGKDEFSLMNIHMNNQMEKVKEIIEQDRRVVAEISDVVEKVSNGFLQYSINEKGATQEVESLRLIINKMIRYTKQKVDNINLVLDNYALGKYRFRLSEEQRVGMYGDFGSLSAGSILLGQSISQLIAMITNAGKELEENTEILSSSSQSLSLRANEQAASLEETAASIEEITSNMQSSGEDVSKMLQIAEELNSSAIKGNDEATKTAKSMDEINEKVTAISEAITVIDQIAFQTNILSLNAAVEAATAGEAGKGFAVVAQEVRNLASRSAEAAKRIKSLVEDATLKSAHGKDITTNMISGYTQLSNKITETKEIIDNVSSAIREQEKGMIQINETITTLDEMTQKNAETSTNIDKLSKEVAKLSTRLLGITEKANIADKYYYMVDDVDLIQSISKYKNDHINFKKKHFSTLNSREAITVISSDLCDLGKWMGNLEEQKSELVATTEWKTLKEKHLLIHNKIQLFVDLNSNRANNDELKKVAKEIEEITTEVFNNLNDIAVVNTKLVRKEHLSLNK
ncbi:chemotaxis protein [Halarcobacter ebronensis]|uniref:Chemotaxis protein n=1 Tax=Halarcobacter ebronensis TaxID=1462615 RepID=A0A4Q0Y887_9BACT|nr:methyl-accepting chemotaxis protein [Halarcobacter ebronensis]RXJ66432.1 chemotaxis protein [Halarcobacter ebronensis]